MFLICYRSDAQNIQFSKTYVNTHYHDQQYFSLNSSSVIFYNPENHELIIVIDFVKFKIGNDTLDEWLDDLDDTKLIFKGYLNTVNLLDLTHHNAKAVMVNGVILFNGISSAHSIELTLFEISKEGMLYSSNEQDYFDRVNANLQFGFFPKEFKIDKKKHHLNKKITVSIFRGYINQFKVGLEHWITN
ncbi:MAG: hypothetical protein H7141_02145 [Burkholderiales bacterium]|nr:hypothetical protein [Bacteroidia bacterium]